MIHLLISCTSLGSILTCDGLDCHAIPVATAAAPPTPSTPIQWLPLGDSITWGCGTDAAPRGGADCCKDCGGYRVPLAWALTQSGHNVTTMGTLTTGPSDVVPARWINHEGHPGWRFDEIDGILDKSLATSATPPNLVTIHLGTNDCGQHDPIVEIQARMNSLLDHIYAKLGAGPNVFLASMIGFPGELNCSVMFNQLLPATVAAYEKKGMKIWYTPMGSGGSPSAAEGAGLCFGGPSAGDPKGDLTGLCCKGQVHPTAAGYLRMASAFALSIAESGAVF